MIIKLCFLQKIAKNNHSLSSRVFRSLAVSDVESLLIVRQCRFLESSLRLNLTSPVLTSPEDISPTRLKKEVLKQDHALLLSTAATHDDIHPNSMYKLSLPTLRAAGLRSGIQALEKGMFGTTCIQALLRFLSLHTFSDNKCPVPSCTQVIGSEPPCIHFLSSHTSLSITVDDCVTSLINCSEDIFIFGKYIMHSLLKDTWNT